jgi:hypothetical protein
VNYIIISIAFQDYVKKIKPAAQNCPILIFNWFGIIGLPQQLHKYNKFSQNGRIVQVVCPAVLSFFHTL